MEQQPDADHQEFRTGLTGHKSAPKTQGETDHPLGAEEVQEAHGANGAPLRPKPRMNQQPNLKKQ